jgi:hypothetical protein
VYARWSTHSQLLPLLEQKPLYDSINFDLPPELPDIGVPGMPYMPAFQDPNRANSTACRTAIAAFLCPSDGTGRGDWPGANSYVGNEGSWLCDACEQTPSTVAPGELPRGPFYNRSCVRLSSMPDGSSQTSFFSEKRRGNGIPDSRTDMYMMDSAMSLSQTYQMCTTLDPSMATVLMSRQGACWVIGDMTCTTYNHVSPPNTRTCAGMGMGMAMPQMSMVNMAVQLPPSSFHFGGVNLLMGDGGVRFIKSSVALPVWRALSTRNGGEVVSASDF